MAERRRAALILATGATAAALALAGCTSATTGAAQPTSPSSSPSGLPQHGAPKVTDPLNPGKYATDPCGLLTTAALQTAGVAAAIEANHSDDGSGSLVGPNCLWNGSTATAGVVLVTKTDKSGLSSVYSSKSGDTVFQPLTVDGYPAVIALLHDLRPNGQCTVTVGIRDDLTLQITTGLDHQDPNRTNPCPVAQKVAGAAVATLKSGE